MGKYESQSSALKSPAYKLFIADLHNCMKGEDECWSLKLSGYKNECTTLKVQLIWIQGTIEQVVGKDILIIHDQTGKIEVRNCSTVPGEKSWFAKGAYCSVIGTLVSNSKIPTVVALKLTNLSESSVFSDMWPYEVKELKLVLTNQVQPNIQSED